MSGTLVDRVLLVFEHGRRPAYFSIVLSAALAGLTGLRFVILVQAITPSEYGVLNLFTLLATLMPLMLSLGLTPQYQRVAHLQGAVQVPGLLRTSMIVTCATVVPGFGIILWVTAPLNNGLNWLYASAFCLVISAATALSTFFSQVMLGLNFRATASLMMFLVNSGATAALLPAVFHPHIGAGVILGWWAVFALAAVLVSYRLVRFRGVLAQREPRVVSIREGLLSIPSQIGPWLLIFVVRYMIGINIDAGAIADYAIASTVVDMAFLVAVSVLNYFTNRVMIGTQSPVKGLLFAVPLFIFLSVIASIGVGWLLPKIGQPGYSFSLETVAILIAAGAVRIYISAWRARALGQRKLHISSLAYIFVVGASLLLFNVWPLSSLSGYALATLGGFILVAVVQRLSVRSV